MEKDRLLRMINELGYPMFEVSMDANEVMAELIKTRDARLWQGFPVVLANMLRNNWFDSNLVLALLATEEDQSNFWMLFTMSLALYEYLSLDVPNIEDLKMMTQINQDQLKDLQKSFENGSSIPGLDRYLRADKVIDTFRNYFASYEDWNYLDYLGRVDEADLEFALSQIFSKRQKDLHRKRLKGEKMTKTEREYYSRVVKKKLFALANSSLHQIANRLIKA